METLNVFKDINLHIIEQIKKAEQNILVCVPWLTDEEILEELVEKSKQKVDIQIISLNDEFNRQKTYFFNRIISNGSKVYLVDKNLEGGIPHNKFCIIDEEILVTGSYNWSNNAKNNDENIIIKVANKSEDFNIICEYKCQFNDLLYKYGIKNENDDWREVIKHVDKGKNKQIEAKKFYQSALEKIKENKLTEALELVNKGIGNLPYSDLRYFELKYHILKSLNNFLESTEFLLKYMCEITDNDSEEIE
jgi:phosphatidylserine/phosphatidylglycerophosphate/cardiolipin synthase-like enzyme